MCQGIRDVANLSWKLSMVLAGKAGDALLDTYGEERGLHVRQLTARLKELGAVICERDPAKARERDARLLAEAGGQVKTVARQDIIPPLAAGFLSATPSSARGTLFPQPWIAQDGGHVRLDAIAGTGWRLVLDGAANLAVPGDAAERLGLRVVTIGTGGLVETDGVLATWFARHRCRAALVRPDHYVYAVAAGISDLQRELVALGEWMRCP
jgi:3-(3-hydroxy-phenyl)propionate hydroxylase